MSPFVNNIGHSDDTITYCGTTISSFDPNFKAVNRPYYFTADKSLIYTIGFENTGNYFATNVKVLDTIDSHLDPLSLKIIGGSPKKPEVIWLNDYVIRFDFSNIHLPDSLSHPEESHGQFVYSINTKADAAVGDIINNTAYIYFDYNSPVTTNTTTNIISISDGPRPDTLTLPQTEIDIFPNPSSGEIILKLPDSGKSWHISLTDMLGRTITSDIHIGNKISMNPKVSAGLYFMKITDLTQHKTFVRKIIRR